MHHGSHSELSPVSLAGTQSHCASRPQGDRLGDIPPGPAPHHHRPQGSQRLMGAEAAVTLALACFVGATTESGGDWGSSGLFVMLMAPGL